MEAVTRLARPGCRGPQKCQSSFHRHKQTTAYWLFEFGHCVQVQGTTYNGKQNARLQWSSNGGSAPLSVVNSQGLHRIRSRQGFAGGFQSKVTEAAKDFKVIEAAQKETTEDNGAA